MDAADIDPEAALESQIEQLLDEQGEDLTPPAIAGRLIAHGSPPTDSLQELIAEINQVKYGGDDR